MTEPTTEAGRAAALVEALTFLSTYEKDPPEVMKDDYAYDRLLAFVHDVAARALAAPAPTVSVSESPTHSWPCPDPDHTYPATPPTPACCLNCGEPVGSSAHLIACHTPETVR